LLTGLDFSLRGLAFGLRDLTFWFAGLDFLLTGLGRVPLRAVKKLLKNWKNRIYGVILDRFREIILLIQLKYNLNMKKLFLFLAFFGCIAFSANAQKACCASKPSAKVCAKAAKDAAKFASLDESIESKVCKASGTVSYVKNYVCPESGKMTSTPVQYDASTQKFVNVSPQNAEQGVGGQNADADIKTVKAVKASKTAKTAKTAKKSCCASKAGKKSCSKSAKVEN